jgi:hypothetical protein
VADRVHPAGLHEIAHPSRGGVAKPRGSLSQPGCRTEPQHVLERNALDRRASTHNPPCTTTSGARLDCDGRHGRRDRRPGNPIRGGERGTQIRESLRGWSDRERRGAVRGNARGPTPPQSSAVRSHACPDPDDRSHVGTDDRSHVGTDDRSHVGTDDRSHAGTDDRSHVGTDDRSHAGTDDRSHAGTDDRSHVGTDDRSHVGTDDRSHAGTDDHPDADPGANGHADAHADAHPATCRG